MNSCLFCSIVHGKIPCTEVYSDENYLAFRDIEPQAPTHILVIPKRHIGSLDQLEDTDNNLMGDLILTAKKIAHDENLDDGGYRFVINCGDDGGQTVGHIHLHILGGRSLAWPPG
jgi:histidine triad (HIT) family protein